MVSLRLCKKVVWWNLSVLSSLLQSLVSLALQKHYKNMGFKGFGGLFSNDKETKKL